MFEAFSVGVRVSLISNVTSGLLAMSAMFRKTHGDAVALQRQIDRIKLTAMMGAALAGTGAFGLMMVGKTIPAAREYAHQLQLMNAAGLKQLEITQAVAAAWKTAQSVTTSTPTGNLRALLDLRSVLGSMDQATAALPVVSKLQAVLAASSGGKLSQQTAESTAFAMAKALDIIGAARSPAQFQREAGMMAKVMTAFQGRVTPQQYQSVFQYARQAKFDLSDEFKYQLLPTLMLEMGGANGGGGGSRGVGPMLAALYRFTNQGFVNKKSIPLLGQLGLLTSSRLLATSTPGTVVAPLRGAALAANNPFLWTQQVLLPAIHRTFPRADESQVRQIINMALRGNQLAASGLVEFATKPQNFYRDQKLIQGAQGLAAWQSLMKKDPLMAEMALRAQLNALETRLGLAILPALVTIMNKLVPMVEQFTALLGRHPRITQALVQGFTALSGAMAFGGTLLLFKAAFQGLGLVFPLVAFGLKPVAAVLEFAVWRSLPSMAVGLGRIATAFAGVAFPAAGVSLVVIAGGLTAIAVALGALFAAWKNWQAWQKLTPQQKADQTKKAGAAIFGGGKGFEETYRNAHPGLKKPASYESQTGSRFIAPRPNMVQVVHTTTLDGKPILTMVTDHLAREMSRQPTGPSGFDDSLALTPVGAGYQGA